MGVRASLQGDHAFVQKHRLLKSAGHYSSRCQFLSETFRLLFYCFTRLILIRQLALLVTTDN